MSDSIFEKMLEETRNSSRNTKKLAQIDESALELFSKKGFSNTSSKEIAQAAGVSEGTIFKHYKTKESMLVNLLLKCVAFIIPVMKKELIDAIENETFETLEAFVEFFIENRLSFVQKNKEMFRVFVKEMIYNDPIRKKLLAHNFDEVEAVLYKHFDYFREKGQVGVIDNAYVKNLFLKLIFADMVWVFVLSDEHEHFDKEGFIRRITQQFLHGIDYKG